MIRPKKSQLFEAPVPIYRLQYLDQFAFGPMCASRWGRVFSDSKGDFSTREEAEEFLKVRAASIGLDPKGYRVVEIL